MSLSAEPNVERSLDQIISHFTAIGDLLEEGIAIVNAQEAIVFVNSPMLRLLDCSGEQIVGRPFEEVMPGHAGRFLWEPYRSTSTVTLSNGERFVELSSRPIPGSCATRGAVVVVSDRTERRRSEEALRSSEARHRALVDLAPDGIALHVDGKWVFANDAALRLLKVRELSEIAGRDVLDFIHPDERDEARERIRRVEDERMTLTLRTRTMLAADGTPLDVEIAAAPVPIEGKNGVQVILRDVRERQKMRRALRHSDRRFQALIEGMNEGLVLLDPNQRIEFANQQLLRMLGYEREELIGADFGALLAADADREMVDLQRLTRMQGRSSRYEIGLLTKAGTPIPVQVSASAVAGERPDEVKSLAVITDLHEIRHVEDELRKGRELIRSIMDATPNFIYSYDLQGRFSSANRAFCGAVQKREADLVGRTHVDIGFSPQQAAEWDALFQRVLETGSEIHAEKSLLLPDGKTHRYDVRLTPLTSAAGKIRGVAGLSLDLTPLLETRDSLRRISSAVEQADEIIFMTDREGVFTYVNPAFTSVYGWEADEIIGKTTPRILKSGLYPGDVYESFWKEILAGRTVRGEAVNRKKDGGQISVQRSVSPLLSEGGEIVGFLSVQCDITERLHQQAEQRRLQDHLFRRGKLEAIGTLAGGIAHDFNNLLMIILSHTALLEKTRSDAERFSGAVTTIRRAVKRGADLASQVLTFARKKDTTFGPVDINKLIAETVSMCLQTFPRNVTFSQSLCKRLPMLVADESQLHQTLLNLFVNARDAMSSGGVISVETSLSDETAIRSFFADAPAGSFVRVQVTDNGSGMSEETLSHIFEPFFTTKTEGKGTGLGLAVAYGVVKSHNGFISVKSRRGEGTTFEIFLPCSSVGVKERDSAVPVVGTKGSGSILFVEDEPDLAETIAAILEEHGYRVFSAADGREALSTYERYRDSIDVVLTDAGLPGLTGKELFTELRKRDPLIPVILASGFIDPDDLEEMKRAGLDRFLPKPYEIEELLDCIRTAVGSLTALRLRRQWKR